MGMAHREALLRLGIPIAGVLGSTPEKSRRAAAAWGTRAYSDYPELLADPEAGVLHLVVPNRLHYPLARAGLEAGRHVLSEKPLAMTTVESADLVRMSRGRPAQAAGVCFNIRFYPLCLQMREIVRSGDLGEVLHVTGSYTQDWLLLPGDYNWRVLEAEGGPLRALADIGSHWLDLAHFVTGLEVESLCADLQTVHPVRFRPPGEVRTFAGATDDERLPVAIATEDAGGVLLRWRGGARGSLWVSQTTAGHKNRLRLEVAGTRGSLSWNSERPEELVLGRRDGPGRLLVKDPSLLAPPARAAAGYPGGHAEGYPDTFKNCFQAFYAAAQSGPPARPDYATLLDGHRELLLGEAVLASHRERCWKDVPPPDPSSEGD